MESSHNSLCEASHLTPSPILLSPMQSYKQMFKTLTGAQDASRVEEAFRGLVQAQTCLPWASQTLPHPRHPVLRSLPSGSLQTSACSQVNHSATQGAYSWSAQATSTQRQCRLRSTSYPVTQDFPLPLRISQASTCFQTSYSSLLSNWLLPAVSHKGE